MGVRLMNLGEGDTVVAVATNAESGEGDDEGAGDVPDEVTGAEQGTGQDADPAATPDQATPEPPDDGATA